jgi:DNA polymerase
MSMNKCIIHSCTKCDIALRRKNIVNGDGDINSKFYIISEAPGYYEDKLGIPFVGNSGKLLNVMLDLIGLTRSDVYITNVIKCRPPNNRTPLVSEITNCSTNLKCELSHKPKLILLLGNTALNAYFELNNLKISDMIGKYIVYNNAVIIATYHPSYLLHNVKNKTLWSKYTKSFKLLSYMYRLLINPLTTTKL